MISPCLLINAYRQERTPERTAGLLLAFAISLAFHVIAIAVSRIFIRKDPEGRHRLERMGAVYSNCGFMAFPVLQALMGSEGVFYATAFVGVFNVVLWIEGITTLIPDMKLSLKKCIVNPGCIAVIIGMITYFFQIPYPSFVGETIEYMASMNTPLSMIITGIFLAQVAPAAIVKDWRIWRCMVLMNSGSSWNFSAFGGGFGSASVVSHCGNGMYSHYPVCRLSGSSVYYPASGQPLEVRRTENVAPRSWHLPRWCLW